MVALEAGCAAPWPTSTGGPTHPGKPGQQEVHGEQQKRRDTALRHGPALLGTDTDTDTDTALPGPPGLRGSRSPKETKHLRVRLDRTGRTRSAACCDLKHVALLTIYSQLDFSLWFMFTQPCKGTQQLRRT